MGMGDRLKELVACRACLAADGRLYTISGSGLEDTLAALTGIAVSKEKGFPRHLCMFCMVKLSKCAAFRDSCQRSTRLLQALLEKGPIKNNDVEAVDRNSHKLTNNLAWTEVFPLATNLEPEVLLIQIENNVNPHDEMECIEVEYLDFEDCDDLNDVDVEKYDLELPIKLKKPEIETDNCNKQLKLFNQIEMKDAADKYTFGVAADKIEKSIVKNDKTDDNDTSENTTNKPQINKNTAKAVKLYEMPPSFDVKAFERKYNVDYKFISKEEQMKDIEERKRNNTLKYCCDMCGRGFAKERSMVNHLWIHDARMGPHECELCRRRFRHSHRLLRHRYRHRDRFTCRDCGLVARDRTHVISHFNAHRGSSYECPYCCAVYSVKNSYYNHVRTNHPEYSVACEQCGDTFLSPAGVSQHKALVHTPIDAAILKCKECDVTFSSAEALLRHEELGAGVPHAALWPCAACGESTGSETALMSHAAEKHPPDQLHCDKCDKTFSNAASFSLHEARKHRCKDIGPLRRKLGTGPRWPGTGPPLPSTRSKELICEICGQKVWSTYLKQHRNAHFGIKPFSCLKCSKKFTTKMGQQQHMLVHTGQRPYPCEQCSQSFASQTNLKRHIKNVHMRMRATCEVCGKCMAVASLYDHVRNVHRKVWNVAPRKRERKRKRGDKRSGAEAGDEAELKE